MEIKTLEHISIAELAKAFNAGFEGYFIKLQLTEEQMLERVTTESIDLSLSVGMYDGERIVGFILTGVDIIDGVLTVNNAGTGVAVEYRGRRITLKLYEALLPMYRERGVQQCLLEVITDNTIAIHLYEKVGYHKRRKVDCYKMNGIIPEKQVDHRFVDTFNEELKTFEDVSSTWQYSNLAIFKTKDKKIIEIVKDGRVVAASVFKPSNGRVMFFGVDKHYRKHGLGNALFFIMNKESAAPLSVINIDSSDAGIKTFLEKMGMVYFLSQYEMSMSMK